MNRLAHDPLLAIARIVLWFLIVALGVAAAGCVIGLLAMPFAWFWQAEIMARVQTDLPPGALRHLLPAASLLLALSIAMLACLLRILGLLLRIVDTVGEGDPFVPENARRLTHMAWLSVAVQAIGVPMAMVGVWLARYADSVDARADIDASVGLDANGLLLVLILFILARVFRKGAAMREDLEGTV